MKVFQRLLDLTGHRRLVRGALAHPSDLMNLLRVVHEQAFLHLTGKKPPSLHLGGRKELRTDRLDQVNMVRRLAMRSTM